MSLEQRTGIVARDIEEIIDDLKSAARQYGGRVKVVSSLDSAFVGSEAILPRTVGQEYIPSTNAEKMDTLPHVSSLWGYSALLREVDGTRRLTVKESIAFDLDDEDGEQRRTLNTASFYRFVWGADGVLEAMKRESHTIDTRPVGYQKVIDRSIDGDGVNVRTLRIMDVASTEGSLEEHSVLVDREVGIVGLRRRIALYASFLAETDESERTLHDFMAGDFDGVLLGLFSGEI